MKTLEEKVKIKTGNNHELAAVIHHPTKDDGKLAILLPGYLDTKGHKHMRHHAKALAKHGLTAVRFDPAGTWESGGEIEQYSITQYLKDVSAVVAFMYTKNNYDNCVIIGHSLGGLVAIQYASQDQRVSEVISIMSPQTMKLSAQLEKELQHGGVRVSHRDIPGKKEEKEFRVPYPMFEDAKQYDTAKILPHIQIPKLFIAGELDDKVVPSKVRELHDAACSPKKFAVLHNIGHDYRHNTKEIEVVNREIVDFLKEYQK